MKAKNCPPEKRAWSLAVLWDILMYGSLDGTYISSNYRSKLWRTYDKLLRTSLRENRKNKK